MKLVWLTDLHYMAEGGLSGFDPRARLEAAVRDIDQHYGDCDLCIISGDLVDQPGPLEYAGVVAALERLPMPYHAMMGNHDGYDLWRTAFALPHGAMEGFAQFSLATEAGLLVCLDTTNPGADAGHLCEARLDWLRGVLKEAKGSVYIFMHHPPISLGLPLLDEIGLQNADAFLDVLQEAGNVGHIFAGHVHQSISGNVRGIPFTIAQSTVYQSRPPRPDWDWDSFTPAPVAPSYAVIDFEADRVVVHTQPFCDVDFARLDVP